MASEPLPSPSSARRAASDQADRLPPRVGRYRILSRLGSGGMGTVYLAEDERLHRTVALKVLVRTDNTPPNLIKRFHAEAQTAAKLRHPNIVTVFDSGEADNFLFLALEYIDGPDLEKVIRKKGRLSVERSVEVVRQIARALGHAHELAVVHRDIKPSNILLRRDGTATLTDLGLARAIDESASSNITRAGFTVGTVDYMSPEQARSSKSADVRSDLYSLGCTWYHMLTGRTPYGEGDLTNKLRAHAQSPPPDPRDVVKDIPAGIVAVVQRMMAKKPDDRYQTPAQLLADLDRPGLCRKVVTTDDLRGLADDVEDSGSLPAIPNVEWSEDDVVLSGSTMIESLANSASELRSPPAKTQRPRKKAAPAARLPKPELKRFRTADKVRAAIVFTIGAILLIICIWALSKLDTWFGGTSVPQPRSAPPVQPDTAPPALDAPPAAR